MLRLLLFWDVLAYIVYLLISEFVLMIIFFQISIFLYVY